MSRHCCCCCCCIGSCGVTDGDGKRISEQASRVQDDGDDEAADGLFHADSLRRRLHSVCVCVCACGAYDDCDKLDCSFVDER